MFIYLYVGCEQKSNLCLSNAQKLLLMSNERGYKENMVGTLNAFIVYFGTWIATIIIIKVSEYYGKS